MIEPGSSLDARWILERAPESSDAGSLGLVRDETGVVRAVMVVPPDSRNGTRKDPAAHAARLAGTTLEVAREVLTYEGVSLELLASKDRGAAKQFYARMNATTHPGARAALLADDVSALADDLASLHAARVVHGGIEPWMLLARDESPHLVLAGFSLSRRVSTPSIDPRVDAERLDAAVLDLARAAIDDETTLAAFPRLAADARLDAWAVSLRAFAKRVGGPYRQNGSRGPLFPREAYREAPIELPTKGARGDEPGLLSEMTPSDWRVLIRIGGFVVLIVLGLVGFLVRSGMRSGPASPPSSERDDRRVEDRPTLGNAVECRGEPTAPVAMLDLPGRGALQSLAAFCGEGAIRVMVHRGSSLWLVTRGSTPGMPWDSWHDDNIITNAVRLLSRAAPTDDGTAFVSWLATDRDSVGIALFGLPVHVRAASVDGLNETTTLLALGATRRFAYLAADGGPSAARKMFVIRVPRDAVSDDDIRADVFTADRTTPLAVWPRSDRPVLLLRDQGPDATHGMLHAVELDLAQLDALEPSPRARALVAGVMRERGRASNASPLAMSARVGVASDLGNGTFADPRFAIATSDAVDTADACDTCTPHVAAHIVTLEHDTLQLLPALADGARPLALVPRIGGFDLLLQGDSRNWTRSLVNPDGTAQPPQIGWLPPGAPTPDRLDAIACGEYAWVVFAGETSHGPAIAALPTDCSQRGR